MISLPFENFGFIPDDSRENWSKIDEDGTVTQIYYGLILSDGKQPYVCTYVKNCNTLEEINIIRDIPEKVYQYIQYEYREKTISQFLDGDK